MKSHQTRHWHWIILALIFATLLKLYLAFTSAGSLDVSGFENHLDRIRMHGGGIYYAVGKYNHPFNFPPFNLHVFRLMGWLAESTGVPFRFWLRLPAILADVGSFFLVWKLLEQSSRFRPQLSALLLLALCPASIMISGFHGNTDPLMIFFVLLSIYLIERGSAAWCAGIVFGIALNVKVVPLIFAPPIFFYLAGMRKRFEYFLAAGVIFIVGSLPYIAQDTPVIIKNVFGYSSVYGEWGWSRLMTIFLPSQYREYHAVDLYQVAGIHALLATIGKWLVLAAITVVSVWMNRRERKPPLFFQCGAVAFLFMFLTPGFGNQYLAWLVPFVVMLGVWPTVIYYAASGLFLFLDYNCLLDPTVYHCPPNNIFTELACWSSVIIVLMIYRRSLKQSGEAEISNIF